MNLPFLGGWKTLVRSFALRSRVTPYVNRYFIEEILQPPHMPRMRDERLKNILTSKCVYCRGLEVCQYRRMRWLHDNAQNPTRPIRSEKYSKSWTFNQAKRRAGRKRDDLPNGSGLRCINIDSAYQARQASDAEGRKTRPESFWHDARWTIDDVLAFGDVFMSATTARCVDNIRSRRRNEKRFRGLSKLEATTAEWEWHKSEAAMCCSKLSTRSDQILAQQICPKLGTTMWGNGAKPSGRLLTRQAEKSKPENALNSNDV